MKTKRRGRRAVIGMLATMMLAASVNVVLAQSETKPVLSFVIDTDYIIEHMGGWATAGHSSACVGVAIPTPLSEDSWVIVKVKDDDQHDTTATEGEDYRFWGLQKRSGEWMLRLPAGQTGAEFWVLSTGPDFSNDGNKSLYLILEAIDGAPYTVQGDNYQLAITDNSASPPTSEQLANAPLGRGFWMYPTGNKGNKFMWRNRHVTIPEGGSFTYGIYLTGLQYDEMVIVRSAFVLPQNPETGRVMVGPCGDLQIEGFDGNNEIHLIGPRWAEITLTAGQIDGKRERCAFTHHLNSSDDWDTNVVSVWNRETGQYDQRRERSAVGGSPWFSSNGFFHGKPYDGQLLLTVTVVDDPDYCQNCSRGGDVGSIKQPDPEPVQRPPQEPPPQEQQQAPPVEEPVVTPIEEEPEEEESEQQEQAPETTTTTSTTTTTVPPTTTTTVPPTTTTTVPPTTTTTVPPTTTTTVPPSSSTCYTYAEYKAEAARLNDPLLANWGEVFDKVMEMKRNLC